MTAARKPTGLGKRKAPETSTEETQAPLEGKSTGESDAQVYFPVDDDQDELQHIQAMFSNAEDLIDDPPKAVILFRAVAHECDRLGRLKERLEEGDRELGDEDIDEEQTARLRALCLDATFYRILGDSLYRLAFLEISRDKSDALNADYYAEDEEKSEERIQMLEASIERYQNGLELFEGNRELFIALQRATLLKTILLPEDDEKIASVSEKILVAIKSGNNLLEDCSFFISAIELASALEGLSQCRLIISGIREILTTLPKQGPQQDLMLLSVLLLQVDDNFERDKVKTSCEILKEAKALLLSLEDAQLEGPIERQFLKLSAQYHIWKGCVSEAQMEDEAATNREAEDSYNRAVEVWRTISNKYAISIPQHILDLETQS